MAIPKGLNALIDQFERNEETYRAPSFNETATRIQFLNPFFEFLGWDVNNRSGNAEAYKDVVHEEALKIGTHTTAPDYSFRVGGIRKFFLEAKRPSVSLKENADAAFQLRRYAWSAKLPVSIASNFAEFAVYDSRVRPSKNDKASVARIFFCTYRELPEKWGEIERIFSKDAIYKGSFDKYAATTKHKRGTAEVDDAFLDEIEAWRASLARNIALRNKLSERELNYAVQQTIDRIVFLRIAEARGIEPYGRLRSLSSGEGIYSKLVDIFKDADDRYNSGLFHFANESGRLSAPDALTIKLAIDDKPLKEILSHLYYPESPYEFSVLPADILGQVYERFLGKIIRLSEAGRATIEAKLEVRKAGGVYYTPTHIVNFIVSQSIAPLLEEKDPKNLDRFRLVDPACGSGSFLLGAYEYLMRWYLEKYIADDPEKHGRGRPPRVFRGPLGEWKLTISERKRILLTHIFGVDIDTQAVEVTKLSLLLRVLERDSAETLGQNFQLFHERALPDLDANIKCGNSLVASDFFRGRSAVGEEIQYQVNAFDWAREFAEVFQDGGFDAVIGNPPYVDSEWMTKTNPALREYCGSHFNSASGNWDLFCVFVEKALRLCKSGGFTSMIVPNKLLSADYAAALRKYMSANATIVGVRDYSEVKVFPVSVYPIVYVSANRSPKKTDGLIYEKMRETDSLPEVASTLQIPLSLLGAAGDWSRLVEGDDGDLLTKLSRQGAPLGTVATVNGAATVSEAYSIQPLLTEWRHGCGRHIKFLNTGTVDPYVSLWANFATRYIKKSYFKPIIEESKWRRLPPKRFAEARAPKIVVGGMTKILECVLDDGTALAGKSTTIILNSSYPLPYLLGLLNSKLMTFFYKKRFSGLALQGGFFRVGPPQLQLLPVPDPEKSPKDSRKLELCVDEITTLTKKLWAANISHDKSVLQRNIAAVESRIDDLVYRLFSLAPSEIATIERHEVRALTGGS